MALFVIGDTHLSLGSSKPMDVFGGRWEGYVDKLRAGFAETVGPEDTVVLCGDLSWGMSLEEAEADFAFLSAFPPCASSTTTATHTGTGPCAAPGAGSTRRPGTRRCSGGRCCGWRPP